MNIKEENISTNNYNHHQHHTSSFEVNSKENLNPTSVSPVNSPVNNLTPPYSSSSSSSSSSYSNLMLFNQANYFDSTHHHNQYHPHHFDYSSMSHTVAPESSLLTFHHHHHHQYYDPSTHQQNSEYQSTTTNKAANSPVSSSSSSISPNNIKTESAPVTTTTTIAEETCSTSTSTSSTPNLIPFNEAAYSHYNRQTANYDYNSQYSSTSNSTANQNSNQNRLSVCLKYASTSDQIQMAAAAAAVAAAAVVSNQSSLLSVPNSSSGVPSSSSSSLSIEDYNDYNLINSTAGSHSRLAHHSGSTSAYSPNPAHLVGFYNNNLLENSSYYKNSAQNCLNLSSSSSTSSASSSTSSSSSSYQTPQNPITDSEYFAYQSYLTNQIESIQSYPINSSSPSQIHLNHQAQAAAAAVATQQQQQAYQTNQFNMDPSTLLAQQQQYLQSYQASTNANSSYGTSRRCSPESTSSSSSSGNFNSSYNNSQVQTNTSNAPTTASTTSTSSSSKYQKLSYLNGTSQSRLVAAGQSGQYLATSQTGNTSGQEAIPPNQLCAVCGDNAACQHYGVRTCEGCKGFFKRTVQKNSKYVCLADKNCPVDKRRRNRCQYCRFQKCLAVGMVKEVVRTNDLKGRRGRLPTKPKSPNNSQSASRNQQSAFLSQIVRVFTDTIPNQGSLDFSKYRKLTKDMVRIEEEPLWILQGLSASCEMIYQWAEKFSTLCRINNLDRDRLVYTNLLDLLVLRMALRLQDNIERIVLCNSQVFQQTQIAYVLTSSILKQIADLGSKLKQPDHAIGSLLVALLYLQDGQQTAQSSTQSQLNELYSKLKELLKEYQQQKSAEDSSNNKSNNSPNYILQLNELFIQTRQISIQLKQRLKQCNLYNSSVYPACIPAESKLSLILQSPDLSMPLSTISQQAQQSQIGLAQMNHQNSHLFHVQQQQQQQAFHEFTN